MRMAEEERRMAEEEKRKSRQPEDWRNQQPANQPPNAKVFNENPRANRGPPIHAADRDWGALRTSDSQQQARPVIRNLENNDIRNNKPPMIGRQNEERDFGNLRKEREPPIRQPIREMRENRDIREVRDVREEKDFGSLRRERVDEQSLHQAPHQPSHADQTDDWRRAAPRKKDENKDPRSIPPPQRKLPPSEERDFGNLRNNMGPPRGGDRINRGPPQKRNTGDDWRRAGDEKIG